MPTESAFLLAGLLFVAAALGYFFARFGDSDADESSSEQLSADYFKGLNYVLNEEPDRAVELFTRMAELDDDALETHFALGSLFRKRGEVDRAIRVHQNLMARPSLGKLQRDRAEAALAEDYLGAGLFDRAESLFQNLCESSEFRELALSRLVRISEITRDWERAIEFRAELEGAEERVAATSEVAHYYCEIAELARGDKDLPRARQMLKKAESGRNRTVRSLLIRADIAHDTGQYKDAIGLYRQVVDQAPDLLVDVIPRMAASCRASDKGAIFSDFLRKLLEKDEKHSGAVVMAAVRDSSIDDPVILDAIEKFIGGDATLNGLVDLEGIRRTEDPERARKLHGLRAALARVVAMRPGYLCSHCGYASLILQWQCPGCRSWETVKPQARIRLD